MSLSIDRMSGEELLLRGDAVLHSRVARIRSSGVAPGKLVEMDMDAGHIYAIQGKPRTPVKIGYSKFECLEGRLASLQTGNPHRLRILAHARGYRSHEQRAHAALGHVRCYNEWFHCSPELTAFVLALRRGSVEEAIAAAKVARKTGPV